jgi:polysaccharide export outer membrane protein
MLAFRSPECAIGSLARAGEFKLRGIVLVGLLGALCGCGSQLASTLPRGAAAYESLPGSAADAELQDYRIGPLDAIDVTVFQEPDLSTKGTVVDASGKVTLPLIGSITAAGKTASELSVDIAHQLGENYLVRPQVSVLVSASVSQKVTVEGEVSEPGVYVLKGPTTLLEAIAMAKGESKIAALSQVAVFRTIDGKRFGAVFDVASIRDGLSDDPQIRANDVVVVGLSHAKSIWRDIVTTAPLLNVFRPIRY